MSELASATLLFGALIGSAWVCLDLQRFLPESHRSRETVEFVRVVITMLVTFAALVLGFLLTSVKVEFDAVGNDLRTYSIQIIELNHVLADYGPETASARALLREYTASTIATTWTQEKAPPDATTPLRALTDEPLENSRLGDMLDGIGKQLLSFAPADALHQNLATEARILFRALMQRRWKIIEESPGEMSSPFFLVMIFWLIVIFVSFGLSAPRNILVFITIGICAASLASAVFVILDLSTPFGGLLHVPSASLRQALIHISQ